MKQRKFEEMTELKRLIKKKNYSYRMMAKKMDISLDTEVDLAKFVDSNAISEYAIDAMKWSVGKGLIKGMSEISLAPATLTARCEVAAIIMRFVKSENI